MAKKRTRTAPPPKHLPPSPPGRGQGEGRLAKQPSPPGRGQGEGRPAVRLIDLSQPLHHRSAVFPGHPPIEMFPYSTHEEREPGGTPGVGDSPLLYALHLSDHAGTHVDAPAHFGKAWRDQTIDTMPLERFYTEAICLNLAHMPPRSLIEISHLETALAADDLLIHPGDTVLLYTDHYRRTAGTPAYVTDWPGLSADAARWLGCRDIAAFGVESPGPGLPGVSNREVHQVCGEMGFTHYENLTNLHELVGVGRFRFIAFPLKIQGGTGAPVRAVAVVG